MGDCPKIVIAQDLDLYPDQVERLKQLGDCVFYDTLASSYDERLERVKDADIICTGKFGLKQRYQELRDTYISLGFVGVGFFDKKILKKNNIHVSNSPGCNKVPVSEWIIAMLLNLSRELITYMNIDEFPGTRPKTTLSLKDKNITILGKGNIGTRVGNICEALEMNVSYFVRGDNLLHSIQDADFVVNALTTNESTIGLLNKNFFAGFKQDAYFINVTDYILYDIDALIEMLDNGLIAGAAIDAMGIQVVDTADPFYRRIQAHPKIIATPHIAWSTDVEARVSHDMMIDNIEAWLKNKPIHLIT